MDEFTKLTLRAEICPYCLGKTEWVDSVEVYGKSYGMVYLCRPCKAWVGTHRGRPKVALGRLADAELREAKSLAHASLDPIWNELGRQGVQWPRNKVYKELSIAMGLPMKYTHIGMFDLEQCKKVVQICERGLMGVFKKLHMSDFEALE